MRDDENFFQFGDVISSDYKVYCSGGGTFSAPARDVELFHVLGRDGDLVVDHGSYQNIDVRYPCWVARSAPQYVNAFRQVLCALRGYQKIVDPYNPGEYRMGIYQAAFEPNMLNANNDSAEFDVIFNCKPQRFLDEGDERIRITSGQNVANPTMYDAHPMLEAYGYGDITVGDKVITIENTPLGPTVVLENTPIETAVPISKDLYLTGDSIAAGQAYTVLTLRPEPYASEITSVTLTGNSGAVLRGYTISGSESRKDVNCTVVFPQTDFSAGTDSTETYSFTITIGFKSAGSSYQASSNISVSFIYDSDSSRDWLQGTATISESSSPPKLLDYGYRIYSGTVIADSSVSANGAPTYIDLDIGEAWIVKSDKRVSVNKSVYIPDILPVLKGNQNTVVTFDNTITRLDIIPRWYTI